jgi:hypothetical protein
MSKFKKLVFAVDFDGTVVFHKFPQVGAAVPGAIDTLRYILSHGGRIVLNTMRSDNPERSFLTEAVQWFALYDIPLYGINKNPGQATWTSSPKVYAHYTSTTRPWAPRCYMIQPYAKRCLLTGGPFANCWISYQANPKPYMYRLARW